MGQQVLRESGRRAPASYTVDRLQVKRVRRFSNRAWLARLDELPGGQAPNSRQASGDWEEALGNSQPYAELQFESRGL